MELDPTLLDLSSQYKLLIGGITPRPIAFVSSVSPDGRVNLAPFSFFTGAGHNPMSLVFCPIGKRDGSDKDTLRNVRPEDQGGTGSFVVNLAVEDYVRKVSACAEGLPFEADEFEHVGLRKVPSARVPAPRVAESPLAFECLTTHVIDLNAGSPTPVPFGGVLVVGRVVHVYVRDDVVNERLHVDHDRVATVGRMGGNDYSRTRERFTLPNGLGTLELPSPFADDVSSP